MIFFVQQKEPYQGKLPLFFDIPLEKKKNYFIITISFER